MTTTHHLPVFVALEKAHARGRELAELGETQAGDNMPVIEARVHHTHLNTPEVRSAAEQIARLGRKVNVTLVLLVTDPDAVTLDQFHGSAILREAVKDGRSARLAADR